MSFKLSELLSTSISPDKADKCPFQRWIAPTVCQRTALEAPNETFSALHLSEHTQLNTRVRDEHWLFSKVKTQLSVKGGLISDKGQMWSHDWMFSALCADSRGLLSVVKALFVTDSHQLKVFQQINIRARRQNNMVRSNSLGSHKISALLAWYQKGSPQVIITGWKVRTLTSFPSNMTAPFINSSWKLFISLFVCV